MPIRKYKPTSPGRRSMSVSTFEEITKKRPEKNLIEPLKSKAGRNNHGRITTRHQGGGAQALLSDHRLQAQQDRHSCPRCSDRIRSKPLGPHRPALLCGRREALHPGADRPEGRRYGRVRTRGSDSHRQCACRCGTFPTGTQIHNIELRRGKGGQLVRSAGASAQLMAKGERLRAGPHAVRRSSARAYRLHGDPRPGRQCRSREYRDRQGGTQPSHGQAADRSRLGHEPARPSAWWWRGQGADRWPAQDQVGQARVPTDAQQQAHRFNDRSSPAGESRPASRE